MPDLRLYRLAFIPALLALVVLAFSLRGAPPPVEPPPGTVEFDASAAAKSTREVLALGSPRTPGSQADNEVADLVAERFKTVVAGETSEQTVDVSVDGEDAEARNVILTLPGTNDDAIVVLAGRDSREGEGAASSAAATGVLLELVNQLSVASRNRTLILASTAGASAEAEGARALVRGLPDRIDVDAAVVISQPGYDEPFEPHVVTAGGLAAPPVGLAETAGEVLQDRSQLDSGKTSALGQIARYAIPAAAGEQAALLDEGVDAVALSSAGELPLSEQESGRDRLAPATLARFGPAYIALVAALDAAPSAPEDGPGRSLRVGDNLVSGWSIALLVLCLLLPPAAVAASLLARSHRSGGSLARAFGWGLEWWLPALLFGLSVVALSLIGVLPATGVPYDPASISLGVTEALALLLVLGLAAWLWWILHLRRVATPPGPRALGAAAGVLGVVACFFVWLANPYLALVLAPLAHVAAVLGAPGRRPAALSLPVTILASVPAIASLAFVASQLDWGASAPVQLAALLGGGGIGLVAAFGAIFLASSAAAVVTAALATVKASPDSQEIRPKSGGEAPEGG